MRSCNQYHFNLVRLIVRFNVHHNPSVRSDHISIRCTLSVGHLFWKSECASACKIFGLHTHKPDQYPSRLHENHHSLFASRLFLALMQESSDCHILVDAVYLNRLLWLCIILKFAFGIHLRRLLVHTKKEPTNTHIANDCGQHWQRIQFLAFIRPAHELRLHSYV